MIGLSGTFVCSPLCPCWLCPLALSVGSVRWLCPLAQSVGRVCWLCPLVVSVGCVRWLCPLGVSVDFVRWLCPFAVSVGCVLPLAESLAVRVRWLCPLVVSVGVSAGFWQLTSRALRVEFKHIHKKPSQYGNSTGTVLWPPIANFTEMCTKLKHCSR